MNYALNAQQKVAWSNEMKRRFTRGVGAKAAKAIAEADGTGADSWKVRLTPFKRGDEAGLKAVFEHSHRLNALALTLGQSPEQLRALLAQVQGDLVEDDLGVARLPGFESFGPLPAHLAYVPLPKAEAQVMPTPPPEGYPALPVGEFGGVIEVEDLVKLAKVTVRAGQAILVGGAPGMGKQLLLKALALALSEIDVSVGWWTTSAPADVQVLMVDALDRLDAGQRGEIARVVREGDLTLIATVSGSEAWGELPHHRSIFMIGPGNRTWNQTYLEHLKHISEVYWRKSFDFSPVEEWLRRDPFASALTQQRDLLGLLARACVDGQGFREGEFQPELGELPKLGILRAAAYLERRGQDVRALFVGECGLPFLGEVARILCLDRKLALSRSEAAQALVKVSWKFVLPSVKGPSAPEDHTLNLTIFPYLQALINAGILHPRGGELRVSLPLVAPALGLSLPANAVVEPDLWERIVLEPMWHSAIVTAASKGGDSAPWILALLRSSPEWSPRIVQALTRLVAEPIPCSDPDALHRAFLLCVWWWGHWPLKPPSTTMSISMRPSIPEAPSFAPFDRVSGLSPLLVLARASYVNRCSLPQALIPICGPEDLNLSSNWAVYLSLLIGQPTTGGDSLRFLIAAPCQSAILFESETWEFLGEIFEGKGKNALGMGYDDLRIWWSSIVAPYMSETAKGRLLLGGVGGCGINIFMRFASSGSTQYWSSAVQEIIKARHPDLPLIFARAFLCVITQGGPWNEDALKELWEINLPRKGRIQDAIALAIAWGDRPWNREDRPWLRWLLKKVIRSNRLEGIWEAWSESLRDDVPWRVFLDLGLSPKVLGAWASSRLEPIHSVSVMGVELGGKTDNPMAEVLAAVIDTGDLDGLLSIMTTRADSWRVKALRRLSTLDSSEGRKLRMWLAASFPKFRRELLGRLAPKAEEALFWKALIESSKTWGEGVIRGLMIAENEPELLEKLWDDVLEVLDELIELEDREAPDEPSELLGLVVTLCDWILRGRSCPQAALESLLSRLESAPRLISRLEGQNQNAFWTLYLRERGPSKTRDLLLALHSGGAERVIDVAPPLAAAIQGTVETTNHQPQQTLPHPSYNRLRIVLSRETGLEVVRSLILEPEVGRFAAQAMAELIIPRRVDILQEELKKLMNAERQEDFFWIVSILYRGVLVRNPEAALSFLTTHGASLTLSEGRALWAESAGRLLATDLGPRAAKGFFEATAHENSSNAILLS